MGTISIDDAELLLWVQRRDFVTCKHLKHYHAIDNSSASRKLRRLNKLGCLDRFKAIESVAEPYYYYLTPRGAKVICYFLGLDEQEVFVRRKNDAERLSLGFLEHARGINDFFTTLLYQSTKSEYPGLITWLNSRECKVEMDSSGDLLIPDGFGEFDTGQELVQFMFEYDRETQTMGYLMDKMSKYIDFAESEEWRDYGLESFPRVLFLTQRERWARNVKRKLEINARRLGKESVVRDNRFLFSWRGPSHDENLLGEVWLRAFNGEALVSLVDR
jgi:hypothetical protein